ncbi:MAG: LysR family transcriptional regulator [Acidocella sp. 20-57-95]|nr:MAG: LysR family transcriptional regulator [Acidocella sp. 20-57-95]OYV59340.1 MAG: LysR family transcriptional regulator [Acidocella sp. 21-58-7]HQT64013.1 LysR family transcriptional regulator [Acidocella sp.]
MYEILNLNRLAYFTTVIEAGSITSAAERLGVTKAVVSHQLSQLESELGVTLILRSTRRLEATEAGREFYARSRAILSAAEAAYGDVSQIATEPKGTLSLSAQVGYGEVVVASAVAEFLERYPHMRVNVAFDDTVANLIDAKLDLGVRVGWLMDTSNQAQRIGTFDQHLVGAPVWAQRLQGASTPAALISVPFVANEALRTPTSWTFKQGDQERETVEVHARIIADKTATARALAVAGAGVSVFPDFLVAADIAAGRLIRLFENWTLPAGGIHVVYPAARFRSAKVRLFVDILKEKERVRRLALQEN